MIKYKISFIDPPIFFTITGCPTSSLVIDQGSASFAESGFYAFSDKVLIGLSSNSSLATPYPPPPPPPPPPPTFGHAPQSFCHFLASDWLSNFHSFADTSLVGLSSNLVDQLIMGLPKPGQLLAMFH